MLRNRSLIGFLSKRTLYRPTRSSKLENTPNAYISNVLRTTLEKITIKSPKDWDTFKEDILKTTGFRSQITPTTIDAMTVGICTSMQNYDLAFSYIDYLEQNKTKLNLATIGKLFRMMYIKNAGGETAEDDEKRIVNLYTKLRESHPVLDSLTLDSAIHALSLTKSWKVCLELLEEIKVLDKPNSTTYSVLVAAAFLNNEDDIAWKLLDEMIGKSKLPRDVVYTSYFRRFDKMKRKNLVDSLEILLNCLQKDSLLLKGVVADDFIAKGNKVGIKSTITSINKYGTCRCCGSKLDQYDITEKEFASLKQDLFKNVIVGKDVFIKSSPTELDLFKSFIATNQQFDVVIDGLNVAYTVGTKKPPAVGASMVCAVISHFAQKGKKVLLLGRNHMKRWPKENWDYITENAEVFLTQDLSQDDPYLLYCALNSGRDTLIVSRDLMRSHKFLLKDFRFKMMFEKWIALRQLHLLKVIGPKNVIFKEPLPYSRIAQKNGQNWHVFIEKEAFPSTCLCIKT